MKHELDISFVLTGFDDRPEEVSRMLAVKPTQTWLRNQLIQNTSLRRKDNGLKIASGLPKDSGFEAHVHAIAKILMSSPEQFKQLCSKYHGQISCAIYLSFKSEESIPTIFLDKSSLKLFADLGMEIDFDLYMVP